MTILVYITGEPIIFNERAELVQYAIREGFDVNEVLGLAQEVSLPEAKARVKSWEDGEPYVKPSAEAEAMDMRWQRIIDQSQGDQQARFGSIPQPVTESLRQSVTEPLRQPVTESLPQTNYINAERVPFYKDFDSAEDLYKHNLALQQQSDLAQLDSDIATEIAIESQRLSRQQAAQEQRAKRLGPSVPFDFNDPSTWWVDRRELPSAPPPAPSALIPFDSNDPSTWVDRRELPPAPSALIPFDSNDPSTWVDRRELPPAQKRLSADAEQEIIDREIRGMGLGTIPQDIAPAIQDIAPAPRLTSEYETKGPIVIPEPKQQLGKLLPVAPAQNTRPPVVEMGQPADPTIARDSYGQYIRTGSGGFLRTTDYDNPVKEAWEF